MRWLAAILAVGVAAAAVALAGEGPAGASTLYQNREYGYRLRYPRGWHLEDLMGVLSPGPDRSPDVIFFPAPERKLDVAMGARVCARTGPTAVDCLPGASQVLAKRPTQVAGLPARQFDLQRTLPREDVTWEERHTLVERAGRTYQFWAAWPAAGPWRRQVQAAYQALLASVEFTRPLRSGRRPVPAGVMEDRAG